MWVWFLLSIIHWNELTWMMYTGPRPTSGNNNANSHTFQTIFYMVPHCLPTSSYPSHVYIYIYIFFYFFYLYKIHHIVHSWHTQITQNTLFTQAQHMKHTRHKGDFLVKIYRIYTHNKRNSPQTHDKIILITDWRHKLSDKTDHFTRNSNFLLYNSDLYSSITMRVLSFTWKL